MTTSALSRRDFVRLTTGAAALGLAGRPLAAGAPPPGAFRLRYVLSTNQYGQLPVADIVPQVHPAGCEGIDLWAGNWGNQQEQVEAMGVEKFAAILARHQAKISCFTCMRPGLLAGASRMRMMKALGGRMVVAGFGGGGGKESAKLRGDALRQVIRTQVEKLKPAFNLAGELGIQLAIENHLNGALESPDAVKMLAEELAGEQHIGIALAPFHLPQDAALLGRLVGDIADKILYYYAWQYGDGSGNLPVDKQKKQLPGVGPLDFKPMLEALKRHRFNGLTAIFMHPTPRGTPLHPTIPDTMAELNRARAHLESELAKL